MASRSSRRSSGSAMPHRRWESRCRAVIHAAPPVPPRNRRRRRRIARRRIVWAGTAHPTTLLPNRPGERAPQPPVGASCGQEPRIQRRSCPTDPAIGVGTSTARSPPSAHRVGRNRASNDAPTQPSRRTGTATARRRIVWAGTAHLTTLLPNRSGPRSPPVQRGGRASEWLSGGWAGCEYRGQSHLHGVAIDGHLPTERRRGGSQIGWQHLPRIGDESKV